jgi:hypothetical protein
MVMGKFIGASDQRSGIGRWNSLYVECIDLKGLSPTILIIWKRNEAIGIATKGKKKDFGYSVWSWRPELFIPLWLASE